MSPELMKLRIKTISIKTKVLIKFGASEMCRFESRKDMKCVQFDVKVVICEILFLTCTEHTSTMSPELNEAQDYDY